MKQLNKPSDNLGGLLKIWAVPPSEITIGTNSVSFSTTDNIIEIYCSPGSMSFTEIESLDKRGLLYKTEIKAFTPKDSPEVQAIITGMAGLKWVVIYIDGNGQYKVAGKTSNPLRVSFNLNTGSDTYERSGHTVLFYGNQRSKAIFISNPFA